MKKRKEPKKIFYKRLIVFIIIVFIIMLISKIISMVNDGDYVQAFSSVGEISKDIEKDSYGNVSRYIVYGTHLNIEGDIELKENDEIKNVQVVAKNIDDEEIEIPTTYTYEDKIISFSTLDKINTGLDLEKLDVKDYYILLKITYSNNKNKYYTLKNDTEYKEPIDYYTLTRNESNNKININFITVDNVPYLGIDISKVSSLPEDVYDVVIDPRSWRK